ncbi:Putrescine-binding periplasmic protein-related [Dorcoceras hygrometricum]|uniref:Putrescine-binding periplasmic protein-related n=1 Tax=Dorcoceras hygrometricum TaxID=472368 RepID=A0A2Z7AHB7_9LAMI|nr:Putrescine-binding periplasmic protein-related [Dorcoceras hygrometricum]
MTTYRTRHLFCQQLVKQTSDWINNATEPSRLVPDAIPKTLRFNLSKRCHFIISDWFFKPTAGHSAGTILRNHNCWRTLSFFNQSEMASSLFTNTVHVCFDSVLAMDNPDMVSPSGKKREMKIEFRLLSDILAKTISVKAGSFDAVTHERFLMMAAINGGVKINWSRFLFNIFKDMVTPGSKKAKGYAIQIFLLLKNVSLLALGDSKEFPASKILTDKTSALESVPIQTVAPISTMPPSAPKRKIQKRKRRLALGSADEIVDEPTAVAVVAVENPVPADADVIDEWISTADDVDNIIEQVIAETAQLETEEEVPDDRETVVGDQAVEKSDEMDVSRSALESVPIQTVAPISTMPPSAPKRKIQKRKRRLALGSAVEIVEEPTAVAVVAVENPVPSDADVIDEWISTADDVDNIIEQVISETALLETEEEVTDVSRPDVGDQEEPIADEMEHWFNLSYEEFVAIVQEQTVQTVAAETESRIDVSATYVVTVPEDGTNKDLGTDIEDVVPAAVEKKTGDESLSLEETLLKISEDSILPSAAGEITKIQFIKGILIKGVNEGDLYKASLPKIPANAKGKAPLKIVDPVRGNPAKEMFTLICADVDFIVQKREKIIAEAKRVIVALLLPDPIPTFGPRAGSVLRDVQLVTRSGFAPSAQISIASVVNQFVQIAASSIFEDQNVQMVINQRPHSPTTSDDSSMHFDDDKTATTPISLPVISTDLQASFAQLRASIEQLKFEQLRRKDDTEKLKDILLMHIRDLEKQFNARFDEHDRAYRALLTNIRKDMHDHKTVLSLDVVKSHQKLSSDGCCCLR